jgi:hypothetical protein
MPIRFVDKIARVARLNGQIDTVAGSFDGSIGSPGVFTGLIRPTTEPFTGNAQGLFQPGFEASGTIATTLGGFTGTLLGPTAASGDNASRISAILNGRAPHFAYSMPADPVPSVAAVVSVTTATAFNNAAAVNGARIRVDASFSGGVTITGSDIDITMDNAYTITGNLTLGNPGTFANRIRWTGGNVVGVMVGSGYADALFDDFSITSDSTLIDLNQSIAAVARVAFLNTTFRVLNGTASSDWAVYFPAGDDLIFANTKILSAGGHSTRWMGSERLLIVDSAINPDNLSSASLRLHNSCNYVWIRDSWCLGFAKIDQVNGDDPGPSVTNLLCDNFARYYTGITGYLHYAPLTNNTGEIRNSDFYGGTITYPPGISNGGGNTSNAWDGTTLPDYSGVGAIR